MIKSDFITDIQEIRKRARQHIEEGAVTDGYQGDRETVIKLLNDSLATEIVCVLRYKRHWLMAKGINSEPVAAEFAQHAQEEQEHADKIGKRIVQLGGEPDLNPSTLLGRSHADYAEGKSLIDMIKEDLIAERIAIDTYTEVIRYIGEKDPTTRRMLEGILEQEEEHADELANMLANLHS